MNQKTIDPYTAAVSPIEMFFNDTPLSRGTAFFWEDEIDRTFIVTNWHNFSGKHPFSRKHLSNTAGEPNRVSFDVFEGGDLNKRRTGSVELFEGETPKWLEHPIHKSRVDVVCMRIDLLGHEVFAINKLSNDQIVTRVAQDVFVLGYPMGIDIYRLPVWKRASVASGVTPWEWSSFIERVWRILDLTEGGQNEP